MSQRIAIYDVNDYILNTIPDLFKYSGTGLKPIFAVQDQPETATLPGPYLTYTVRTSPNPDNWWTIVDDVGYMIWDFDIDEIQPISFNLITLFREMDDSATAINAYLESINKHDFYFHSFRVVDTMMPAPLANEGERYGQPFNLRYSYSINQ